jgi:imidazolonepropionase-like amidohydrolase
MAARTWGLWLILGLLSCASGGGRIAVAAEGALVLTGARIFDSTGATWQDGSIVLQGERIVASGPGERIHQPHGARVVDLSGHWILPGLIDAHVHFFQSGSLYTRPDMLDLRRIVPYEREIAWIRERLPATLTRYLASGVTSVMDMAGPEWVLGVRDLAAQSATAPRVAVAGPGLAPMLPSVMRSDYAPGVVVRSPGEARREVRRLAARRPDLIKIWFVITPAMDLEQEFDWVTAAVQESHALGLRVGAHATELEVARRMVRAGVDILVHSVDDVPVDEAFLEALRRRDVTYIPTLSVAEGYREALSQQVRLSEFERRLGDPVAIASLDDLAERFPRYRPPRRLPDSRIAHQNLLRVQAAGVRVAAGSDAGNIGTLHGPALHHELELMARAGLSPRDILVAATRNAAVVLGREQDLGTLEAGKLADLLILSADPLEDIRNTRRIAGVVKGGVLYRLEELMARL